MPKPPAPGPLADLPRRLGALIGHHQLAAIGLVIAVEEAGVPLPIPGDIFLLYAGYFMSVRHLSFWPMAFAVAVLATLGASVLYWVARHLGSGFLLRHGRLLHLDAAHLTRVERLLHHFGPPIIVLGRFVPGFRIVLSALAGVLRVSYPRFAVAVAISSLVWAMVLLQVGQRLGRQVMSLMQVDLLHILPGILLLLGVVIAIVYARHRRRSEVAGHVE